MEPEELRDLILPYDLNQPNEVFADLSHVTGVLQTDLLMPLTTNDQRVSHIPFVYACHCSDSACLGDVGALWQ